MKSTLVVVLGGLLLFVSLIGCSSALHGRYPDIRFPLPVNEDTPALLFPINLSHLGAAGATTTLGVALSDAIINSFGARIIADQQLLDVVGDLSAELPDTVDSQVRRGSFTLTGSGETVASNVTARLERIVAALVERGRLNKPIQFRYIITVHSHGRAAPDGALLTIESVGSIYDTDTTRIVAYLHHSERCANEEQTILAKLSLTYNNIIESLIQGAK